MTMPRTEIVVINLKPKKAPTRDRNSLTNPLNPGRPSEARVNTVKIRVDSILTPRPPNLLRSLVCARS